ncbi:MAG: hypothetical protein B6I19_11400 [Bacteroidetes bacterium 4572_114]|nr:MAG: hypothetical protein B6I19_11400 [Bacteroidetes bacterium 4572_114]
MTKEKLKVGEISKPRFEFRTFGRDFQDAAYLMSRLSIPVPKKVWERTSEEIYIISRTNDVNNTKIRNGKMDIKTFVSEVDGLEQWNPLMKGKFPMKAEMLEKEVFPAFRVEMPKTVEKERYGFMVNDTICEYANVYINGAMVTTINSESTEIEDIKKTINIGMIDKKLAN